MILVGVTGGIGSGKSLICQVFSVLGYPVFYADLEARIAVEQDDALRKQLINEFGTDIYSGCRLNKEKMTKLVFSNPETREVINNLVHPAVRRRFEDFLKNVDPSRFMFYEAAILFESGVYKIMDKCITVFAPEQTRIDRVKRRDGHSSERIKRIIASQMSEQEKIEKSDFVINNHGSHLIIPQALGLLQKL